MDTQLGDAFFDTRSRLSYAIVALSKLVEEIELDRVQNLLLQSLLKSLNEPFLFVVVGEVNAGKSTLLNALFGHSFCETAALPMTSEICLFKYGAYEKDICITDTLTELYRPNEFLKDFNIVDTPGTNSIMEHHQEITERFIPMADLVIFTFSVVNPWGASAWALLGKIHQQWYKNIIFVLQQCDLREPDEIEAIIEHLKVTSKQRLGTIFPVFPVSGKKAFLSKTTALDKERLWRESRFENLEAHIADVVDSPRIREQKLGNASRSARVVLRQAEEKLEAGARILKADEELIGGLGAEVSTQRDRTLHRAGALRRLIDSEYVANAMRATRRFQDHLGFSQPERNGSPDAIERQILDGLTEVARREVETAASAVAEDLQDLWRRLAENMQEHFNFRLRVGTESGEPEWTPQREHLRSRLLSTLEREIAKLQLSALLNRRVASRRAILGGFIAAGLASLVTAFGLVHFQAIPESLNTTAILLGVFATIANIVGALFFAQRNSRSLVELLAEHLEAERDQLNVAVREELSREVNGFFDDFIRHFDPLHRLCDEHRVRYQPQITELHRVADALDQVDLLIGLPPSRHP
ncbi:MAG: dynamin family protein [Verrucomicrobia bacterium]|nr:dynamin family protein [Verrucomicrobiota bacterium]